MDTMRRSNSSKKQRTDTATDDGTDRNAADSLAESTLETQSSKRKSRYSRLSAYENGETTFLLLVLNKLAIRIIPDIVKH